mmetsp:Transcript_13364/g.25134  ORF Transcript_13364/g.25134 Transcript_13364/m.25134 type:complete len:229 (+) Transcript_13364:542-1228(+)
MHTVMHCTADLSQRRTTQHLLGQNHLFPPLPPIKTDAAATATAPTATPATVDCTTSFFLSAAAISSCFSFSSFLTFFPFRFLRLFSLLSLFFFVVSSSSSSPTLVSEAAFLLTTRILSLSSSLSSYSSCLAAFEAPPPPNPPPKADPGPTSSKRAFPPHTSLFIRSSNRISCPRIVAVIWGNFSCASFISLTYIFLTCPSILSSSLRYFSVYHPNAQTLPRITEYKAI